MPRERRRPSIDGGSRFGTLGGVPAWGRHARGEPSSLRKDTYDETHQQANRHPECVATLVLLGAGAAHADAVTDWNAIMQTTVSASPTNPVVQSRSAAIVQLAVFEAVNAIVGDYEPYLGTIDAPPWASPDAAAIAAAHRTLVALHPGSAAALDALRDQSLAAIPDGPAKEAGIAVGEDAAAAMLPLRADDGSGRPRSCPTRRGPIPVTGGRRRPRSRRRFLPGWGQVTPFGLEDGSQFRLPPPPALHTGKYAKDYNEVKLVGRVDSPVRPQDRTDVARFYAAALPVQLWNPAARQASAAQGKTLSENAQDLRPAGDGHRRWLDRGRSRPSTTTTSGGP